MVLRRTSNLSYDFIIKSELSEPQYDSYFGSDNSLLWDLSCALWDVQQHPSLDPLDVSRTHINWF